MATRNLSDKFFKLRSQFSSSRPRGGQGRASFGSGSSDGALLSTAGEVSSSSSSSSSWEQARHTLPPYWVETVEECTAQIDDLRSKLSELENVHRRRLMVFDENEEQQLEAEIDILTQQITSIFKKTERNLKRIFGVKQRANGKKKTRLGRICSKAWLCSCRS